ncbi:MAG TPA: prolyl oligopeptidase family serine peptidase [Gemmatimonadaceae bacterium]|nr:prolyl oligopeptidase family serine peptidase [Gemmatimonadaceae bacterium]
MTVFSSILPMRALQRVFVVFLGATLFALPTAAQTAVGHSDHDLLATETYVRPPAVVDRIIMAPRTDISFTQPSPDRKWFLKSPGLDRGDVAQFGKPHVYLGGIQVDTHANRARSLTTSTHLGLILVDPKTNATKTLETPKGASISAQVWSPTGTQVAYIANFDDASQVYVADVATGKSVQVSKTPLLGVLVTTIEWTADGKSIIAVVVPDGRGPAPVFGNKGIADGPEVRMTESRTIPQVIHPSLLEDPFEKASLKYYSTGQLALIDVKTKTMKKIGAPGMIRSVDASPDGLYFRVTEMTEPFSYLVPASSFGSVQELWDANGKVIAQLNKQPLREGEAAGDGDTPAAGGRGGLIQPATDTGKRNIAWNPVGNGLVYFESIFSGGGNTGGGAGAAAPAGAGGGRGGRGGRGGAAATPVAGRGTPAARPAPTSVRFMSWTAPYGPNDTKLIYEGSAQLAGVAYSYDGKTMFVTDSGSVIAVRAADPSKRYNLGRGVTVPAGGGGRAGGGGGAFGGGADTSTTGGRLEMKRGPNGANVVMVGSDNKTVYLSGTRSPGANWNTQAPRPWVDKLDFETGKRDRVFDSPANAYDEFVSALDDDFSAYIYTHESPTVIQDAYLRDAKAGTSTQITHAKDVAPEVSGAQHKRIQLTRQRDGIKFWVDLTLPADWKQGTRLPGIIWFYPREYTAQADYDRSRYTTNINKFPDTPALRPASSTKLWVTQGYAVIEPDCPIIGAAGKMNDNYARDLAENLELTVNAMVDQGYIDREHVGIGGHSYGAFSTVNALTLTSIFKAGIAGDGMYNRSLTPFGFQSERRNFFEAQSTYLEMSPFFRADKISGPLLMYHSLEDQNVGTAPISSIRMFHALQGLGKPAALFMYPYEDHSVATYQTDLDQWARWFAWFDMYVKNPSPKVQP